MNQPNQEEVIISNNQNRINDLKSQFDTMMKSFENSKDSRLKQLANISLNGFLALASFYSYFDLGKDVIDDVNNDILNIKEVMYQSNAENANNIEQIMNYVNSTIPGIIKTLNDTQYDLNPNFDRRSSNFSEFFRNDQNNAYFIKRCGLDKTMSLDDDCNMLARVYQDQLISGETNRQIQLSRDELGNFSNKMNELLKSEINRTKEDRLFDNDTSITPDMSDEYGLLFLFLGSLGLFLNSTSQKAIDDGGVLDKEKDFIRKNQEYLKILNRKQMSLLYTFITSCAVYLENFNLPDSKYKNAIEQTGLYAVPIMYSLYMFALFAQNIVKLEMSNHQITKDLAFMLKDIERQWTEALSGKDGGKNKYIQALISEIDSYKRKTGIQSDDASFGVSLASSFVQFFTIIPQIAQDVLSNVVPVSSKSSFPFVKWNGFHADRILPEIKNTCQQLCTTFSKVIQNLNCCKGKNDVIGDDFANFVTKEGEVDKIVDNLNNAAILDTNKHQEGQNLNQNNEQGQEDEIIVSEDKEESQTPKSQKGQGVYGSSYSRQRQYVAPRQEEEGNQFKDQGQQSQFYQQGEERKSQIGLGQSMKK
ncbi:hypothetical protein [Candidatus Deianiraea vastatrix]|uniref:Uncharacterized protein n=1 Tax=Candidatus Deianiraea vastatrix TaxID=2163644 RepID=A0A5B8XE18_9RICK|nr:hypothetical protein [Candidatus Deianiraea vastatrix]QED23246.1 hypothetical protein Deia_00446 [Candidatus Deianiraea vastatrix]